MKNVRHENIPNVRRYADIHMLIGWIFFQFANFIV